MVLATPFANTIELKKVTLDSLCKKSVDISRSEVINLARHIVQDKVESTSQEEYQLNNGQI